MAQPTHVVAAVDDDRRVRDSVQSVLESAGYEAEMFASAEAFLEAGAVARARCVVVDVRLPGMDGLALQRRIRTERPALPVLVVTAHDDDETRRMALGGGAVAFMVKPFDAAELIARIEGAITGRR